MDKLKVLFCDTVDLDFVEKRGSYGNFEKMPKEVLLEGLSYEGFKSKMNYLQSISDDEYLLLTKDARQYYMNYTNIFPHEIIKKNISNYCSSV